MGAIAGKAVPYIVAGESIIWKRTEKVKEMGKIAVSLNQLHFFYCALLRNS